jgi:hypothetical protein
MSVEVEESRLVSMGKALALAESESERRQVIRSMMRGERMVGFRLCHISFSCCDFDCNQ